MSLQIEDTSDLQFEWLNEELFEPIFEKELNLNKTEFTLKLVSVKPAVGKGENYLAQVTRVQVEVTLNSELNSKLYSFIIKSNLSQIKEMNEWGPIEKEMAYYKEVAPKLIAFDETVKFTPRCFLVSAELDKLIILEDLAPAGYTIKHRSNGLDLAHCKLFYKKLGQYHAITAAYCDKHGEFEKTFHVSRFGLHGKSLYNLLIKFMYPTFLEIFTKYDYLKQYYEQVKNWDGKLYETMYELTDIKSNEFNVLNHGDSWVNNLLYLYDDDSNPIDVSLIDHQLTMFGTPIFDILYFFITSPSIQVRANHFDDVILVYHKYLVKNLKKYGYSKPIPTMGEIQMEIVRKGPIGCFFLFFSLAIVHMPPDEANSLKVMMEDCNEGRRMRYNMYNNPRFLQFVEPALQFLEKRGLLIE